MNHLTDDEIFRLAEVTEEELIYDEHEVGLMQHLKSCRECYDKYCTALALMEVTSDSGYMALSKMYDMAEDQSQVSENMSQVLAVIQLVKEKVEKGLHFILDQIEQPDTFFHFQPVVFAGARGKEHVNTHICKLEDMDDEKTSVFVDSQSDAIMVQINIHAFLQTKSGRKLDIPLKKSGKIYKGVLEGLPSEEFKIIIEKRQ